MSTTTAVAESVVDELMANGGIGFAAAAKLFPAHRGEGKALNPTTILRWHSKGVKRPDGTVVRLEAAKVGGRFLTSEAAVRRFVSALSEPVVSVPAPRSPAARSRASEAAARQLESLGA